MRFQVFFKIKTQEIPQVFASEFKSSHSGAYCPVTNRHDVYCPISAVIRTVNSQSVLRILL